MASSEMVTPTTNGFRSSYTEKLNRVEMWGSVQGFRQELRRLFLHEGLHVSTCSNVLLSSDCKRSYDTKPKPPTLNTAECRYKQFVDKAGGFKDFVIKSHGLGLRV